MICRRLGYLLQIQCLCLSFAHCGSAVAEEYKCEGPDFSHEHIIKIVERERRINPKLPPLAPEPTIKVRKERCHYTYLEYGSRTLSRIVKISEYGDIVYFIVGKSVESRTTCPDVNYTKEELAAFLEISRTRYSDLPSQPKDFYAEVGIRVKGYCKFVYSEIENTGSKRKGHSYVFDYYGDLMSVHTIDY